MKDMDQPTATEERHGFAIRRPVIRASGAGRVPELDAAKYLGCSPRHLRRMRARDEGPSYETLAGRIWYSLDDLDEYLQSCRHETQR